MDVRFPGWAVDGTTVELTPAAALTDEVVPAFAAIVVRVVVL